MGSRMTLKSVSVEGLKPTITLTPVIEPCVEGYRIHHIKSDSIARDGRDTFVPLRHASNQKRRIFELEEENAKLRQERDHWLVEQVHAYGNWEDAHKRASELESENAKLREQNAKLRELVRHMFDCLAHLDPDTSYLCDECPRDNCQSECDFEQRMRELGIEVGE